MEPLAPLAIQTQPVWQAGQPTTVNIDYDGVLLVTCECFAHVTMPLLRSAGFWYDG